MKRITFSYYPGAKTKAITMSYDDGQVFDRRLVDIFNRTGFKGTFHLNAGTLDQPHTLSSSELKETFRGHEVSAHSLTHPHLTQLSPKLVSDELLEDRRRLEQAVGYPVRGMSYPFGDYDDALVAELPYLGIEYSRTCQSHGNFMLPTNFLTWHPTCHHKNDLAGKLKDFENRTPWASKMPLFYIWGHSFEFERENNWSLIEDFCRAASGNPDVWYATNIEIMDYLLALRALRFSVDNSLVRNTASQSVWIGVDGEAVEIPGGAAVAL